MKTKTGVTVRPAPTISHSNFETVRMQIKLFLSPFWWKISKSFFIKQGTLRGDLARVRYVTFFFVWKGEWQRTKQRTENRQFWRDILYERPLELMDYLYFLKLDCVLTSYYHLQHWWMNVHARTAIRLPLTCSSQNIFTRWKWKKSAHSP